MRLLSSPSFESWSMPRAAPPRLPHFGSESWKSQRRIEFGRYYVHIDKHDQATDFRSGLDARREKLRRELVERGLI